MSWSERVRGVAKRAGAVDAMMIAVVCLLAVAGYLRFSEPYRDAASVASALPTAWYRVDLCLPAGTRWMLEREVRGLVHRDPRSGAVAGELLSVEPEGLDSVRVAARLRVVETADGRVVFLGQALVLGRTLRLDTAELQVEGLVCVLEREGEAE